MGKSIRDAIEELASLKEGWSLQAEFFPSDFLLDVADHIRELRALLQAAEAKLALVETAWRSADSAIMTPSPGWGQEEWDALTHAILQGQPKVLAVVDGWAYDDVDSTNIWTIEGWAGITPKQDRTYQQPVTLIVVAGNADQKEGK